MFCHTANPKVTSQTFFDRWFLSGGRVENKH